MSREDPDLTDTPALMGAAFNSAWIVLGHRSDSPIPTREKVTDGISSAHHRVIEKGVTDAEEFRRQAIEQMFWHHGRRLPETRSGHWSYDGGGRYKRGWA